MKKGKLKALGRAIFDEAKADLEARNLWAEIDSFALEVYALELQTYFELLAQVEAEGVAVDTGTGSVKSNPKVMRMDSALKNSVQLARLLGIGPDARNKLKATNKPRKEDERPKALRRMRIAKG